MGNHIYIKNYNLKLNGLDTNDPYVQQICNQGENPEPALVNFLKANFADSSITVFDIGANIGLTSLLMARLLGETSKIYAFEPGRNIYRLLKANIDINGLNNKIFPVQAAVSEHEGVVHFSENSAYGHISQTGDEVKMISVPSYKNENGLDKIDFVKIDVEGFEPEVFRGLCELTSRPVVFFELNTWTLVAYGRHNPVVFLESLLDDWDIYEVSSVNELLPIKNFDEILRTVHSTMVLRGCVSDCIALPKGTEINLNM